MLEGKEGKDVQKQPQEDADPKNNVDRPQLEANFESPRDEAGRGRRAEQPKDLSSDRSVEAKGTSGSGWNDVETSSFTALHQPAGQFHVERDAEGGIRSLEGWAARDPERSERGADRHERKLQSELQARLPQARGDAETKYDASHIIPYQLMGREHMVGTTETINRSHMAAVEHELGRQIDRAPDKQIYIRCTLTPGERPDLPESMHTEAFARDSEGRLNRVHDSELRLQRVAQPLSVEARALGQRPAEFVSPRKPKVEAC